MIKKFILTSSFFNYIKMFKPVKIREMPPTKFSENLLNQFNIKLDRGAHGVVLGSTKYPKMIIKVFKKKFQCFDASEEYRIQIKAHNAMKKHIKQTLSIIVPNPIGYYDLPESSEYSCFNIMERLFNPLNQGNKMVHLVFQHKRREITWSSDEIPLENFIDMFGNKVTSIVVRQMGVAIAVLVLEANLDCGDIEFLLVKGDNPGFRKIAIVDFGLCGTLQDDADGAASEFLRYVKTSQYIPFIGKTKHSLIFLNGVIKQGLRMNIGNRGIRILTLFYVEFLKTFRINTLMGHLKKIFDNYNYETILNSKAKIAIYEYFWKLTKKDISFSFSKLAMKNIKKDIFLAHLFKKELDINKPINIKYFTEINLEDFGLYSELLDNLSYDLIIRKKREIGIETNSKFYKFVREVIHIAEDDEYHSDDLG